MKTTIQLLLSSVHTEDLSLSAAKHTVPCHKSHAQGANTLTSNGPSLSTISWGYNRLDVYGNDQASGNVSHKWWDGYQWGPSVGDLELLGGDFDTPPSAVSGNTSKMDVFSIGQEGDLQHKYFDGSSWQPAAAAWDSLKGDLDDKFAPSTTSWAPGRLDVFTKGVDGGLYLNYYDGSNWGPSGSDNEALGGSLLSAPAAVSWGPNRNDVRRTRTACYVVKSSKALMKLLTEMDTDLRFPGFRYRYHQHSRSHILGWVELVWLGGLGHRRLIFRDPLCDFMGREPS